MAVGGARSRSGPAPSPLSLRQRGEWVDLPAAGRAGDPPDWPLTEMDEREQELWVRVWSRPQAVEWEKLGQEFEVALYVRRLAEAEKPGAPVTLATLVKQMADALGLTIPGMKVNRWRLTAPKKAASAAEMTEEPAAAPRSRHRFQVIDGAA